MASNKSAVEDGKLARKKVTGRVKKPGFIMTADEVVATIKKHIRKALGDSAENHATVYATSGYFYVQMNADRHAWGKLIRDEWWRQEISHGTNFRRYSIGLLLRAIHGEVLTDQS